MHMDVFLWKLAFVIPELTMQVSKGIEQPIVLHRCDASVFTTSLFVSWTEEGVGRHGGGGGAEVEIM